MTVTESPPNARGRPEGRPSQTSWRASATSDYGRASWTVRYVADREHVHSSTERDLIPDVDQLAADVVALYGPGDAVRYAKRFYAAMMRTAGTPA